ncbi:MAG: glycerophosphodiester phosphodiesterase [Gemmatimonadota bacterium]
MEIVPPDILAHRGVSGHYYENSRAAFRAVRQFGADGAELDIHATRDGKLVVHHDLAVAGVGEISELDWSSLREVRLPNGEPLPLLHEALEHLAGLVAWIEVKALPARFDRLLLEAIDRSGTPERCAVHSFDHRIIRRLGEQRPALRRGVLSASYPIEPVTPIRSAGAVALWQQADLIDADLVALVHAAGAEIVAWTVNDAGVAARLAAVGVDALCGNYPERLVSR